MYQQYMDIMFMTLRLEILHLVSFYWVLRPIRVKVINFSFRFSGDCTVS